jgi:flagellar hook-basal body complex protein FliE
MIDSVSKISGLAGAAPSSLIPSPTTGATSSSTAGADFSQVLSQLTTGAVNTVRQGEAASVAGIENMVPVQQVVQSITAAEQTLQTVIAVRDKVVSAWQQISQMAI